jgi:hypothetical protein
MGQVNWYEKPLQMSVADICKEYREAKEHDKQIKILADLNDTQTTRIAYLLARAGENVEYRYLPRAPRTPDGVDLNEVWATSPEAAEADAVRAARAELTGSPVEKKPVEKKPVEKKPVEKKPVDDILAELWTVYLGGVRFRELDGMDVRAMMSLRDIAELIGGIEE